MAIPPFNDLRLKKGEWPKQERLEELLEGYARNFEDLYNRAQTVEASNEAGNEFLRLAVKGKRKIAWGNVELEWNGAGPASNTKEVTHGLGVVPTFIALELATLITVAGNANLFGFGTEPTSKTVFKCNSTLPTGSVPGAGTKVKFFWTAFG